jgi:Archaeal shikimate kinase
MPNEAEDGLFIASTYFEDPVGYVRDVLQAEPDTWQIEALNAVRDNKRVAGASGHGIGKTAFVAWIIHWFMATRPNPQVVVTANTKNQLDSKTWRELAKWNQKALNGHWFEVKATRMELKDSPETWFASAIPWTEHNSESFAGTHEEHVLVVFDEASAIADVIWDVVEGAMTTPGARWVALGNPTRNTGRFRECWGRFRHRWHTMQVDSRKAKMADQTQIAEWIADYGEDSDFVRVRVKGEFPKSSSAQLISSALVEAAIEYKAVGYEKLPLILGVDVARFGDDQTVICARRGRKVYPLSKFRELDTMQVAGHVAAAMKTMKPALVNIDIGAMGAGVVDRLREQGYDVRGVNFGGQPVDKIKFANKRAEMWGDALEWLKEGGDLPDDYELKQDLIGPEYSYTSSQQLLLEKKESMKRRGLSSPDCADAFALTFAAAVSDTAGYPAIEQLQPDQDGIYF